MAVVTVTGKLSDFSGVVIPAGAVPELWFMPERSMYAQSGLLAGVESQAVLDVVTGAFTVQLDNVSDYVPVLRWVLNPSESLPERRAWGRVEWPRMSPGLGGDIGHLLPPEFKPETAYYFGALSDPPPEGFRGYWEVQAEPGREDSDDPFIGDVRMVYGG